MFFSLGEKNTPEWQRLEVHQRRKEQEKHTCFLNKKHRNKMLPPKMLLWKEAAKKNQFLLFPYDQLPNREKYNA